jgi:hypothetical protein
MDDKPAPAVPLEDVLEAERKDIKIIRELRRVYDESFSPGASRPAAQPLDAPIPGKKPPPRTKPPWVASNEKWAGVIEKAHSSNFVGLAFSGGGIRSATFNLGILQALADLKLLYRVDYLSTVSGGGYIGGWLAAWTKRAKSFAKVQAQLSANRVHQKYDREPTPIRFLRMFSNYLTPKLGVFSGDTWAMVAIYLRNTLLNLVIVLSLVAASLMVPRMILRWAESGRGEHGLGFALTGAAAILLLVAFFIIVTNMAFLDSSTRKKAPWITSQPMILVFVSAPIFAAAVLASLLRHPRPARDEALEWAIAYAAIWFLATLVAWVGRKLVPSLNPPAYAADEDSGDKKPGSNSHPAAPAHPSRPSGGFLFNAIIFLVPFVSAFVAGALAGWLFALLSYRSHSWFLPPRLTLGAPLVVFIFCLAGSLHIGLMGTIFRDWKREWWGRLGGWLMLGGIVWTSIFWIALFFPHFVLTSAFVKSLAAKYLTPAWILSTAASVFAGKSSFSGENGKSPAWLDWAVKIGPYVFIAGLFCWISYLIDSLRAHLQGNGLFWAFGICVAIAAVMSWRVDVNEFSMHLFYRNRLVRCYLGASNVGRSPNRFTGFDRTDDIPLKNLRIDAKTSENPLDPYDPYDGPYPVINTTLNLVKGKDLAWQERKAESFVLTPRYCGYDVWLEEQDSPILQRKSAAEKPETIDGAGIRAGIHELFRRFDRFGYRPTEKYAFPPPFYGPFLGLAMSISGAAASPSMGSYSSTPVGFLMTIFNVRLGQWMGNPRHRRCWQRPTPRIGLSYLINELLGGTTDEAAYVYLSDGGHFENMGLYELVKRRCGLIILGDAEADSGYAYTGLGNAIRKCRIDLGVNIDLNVDPITPSSGAPLSSQHCAIGTIHYENVDVNAPTGTLIYFKSSLTGDEPNDVKNYKKSQKDFPHQTTADQWFNESQFESYRRLGYHEVITSILGDGIEYPHSSKISAATHLPGSHSGEAGFDAQSRHVLKPEAIVAGQEESKPSTAPALPSSNDSLESRLQAEFAKFGFDISRLPLAPKRESRQ